MIYPSKLTSKQVSLTPKKISHLKLLYQSGLSMRQVGKKMGCSTASINHVMRRHHLPRRTTTESNHLVFINSPLSFSPIKKLSPKQHLLKTAGLMLYWAEGSKKNSQGIDFANSDPKMIHLFTKFLRQIYQINNKRLRCLLYCYPSHNPQKLINFWSKITQIPASQFIKPYIRSDGGQIRDKMKHGLVHIRYSDKRLFQLIMKEINQFSNLNMLG